MYLKQVLLTVLFLGSDSFSINRRQALGSFIGMTSSFNTNKDESADIVKREPYIKKESDIQKKIFLNKEEVSLEKLNQKLKVLNSEKMKKVVISGDKEVAYGVIVEVLDELRKLNNLKIAISTK